MPEMADSFLSIQTFELVRFGEWEKILKMPKPDEKMTAMQAAYSYARTDCACGDRRLPWRGARTGDFREAEKRHSR